MSTDDDDLLLEWNLLPWETSMPPVMHPIPVEVLPTVPVGEKVAVRSPGPVWVIDDLMVDAGPIEVEGETWYEVLPVSEPSAAAVRPEPGLREGQMRVFPQRVRACDLFVYRDERAERTIDDLAPATGTEWLERVGDGSTPPVRRPRPARELPLLTGHRVRAWHVRLGWVWYVAVGEPIDKDGKGDVRVPVMTERNYWDSVYQRGPTQLRPEEDWIIWPQLHGCWAY